MIGNITWPPLVAGLSLRVSNWPTGAHENLRIMLSEPVGTMWRCTFRRAFQLHAWVDESMRQKGVSMPMYLHGGGHC